MANTLYSNSLTTNHARLIAQKLVLETKEIPFWGRFMKFNTPDKKAHDPNKGMAAFVKGAPIIVHRELERQQGNIVEVPMLRDLDNLPKIGREQLEGHEEEMKMNHCKVYLDRLRHAVNFQDSRLMKQITKEYMLAERAKPLLQRHYARIQNYYQCSNAFYKGFSGNVLDSNFLSVSAVDHPHVFVAGSGKVSYSGGNPGTTGYQDAIGTDISAMAADAVFDTGLLQGLNKHEQIRKIPRMAMKDGTEYLCIAVHPYQIATLEADANFRAVTASALSQQMAKENPYLTGCKYFWNGWAIFDAGNAVFPVAVSSGDPVWGPSSVTALSSYEGFESYTSFAAIVFGDNAMAKATGSPMEFIPRTGNRDYGEIEAIAYDILEGYARPDYKNLDDGTAGAYWRNDTSAIVVTRASAPSI